jgi:hypothetical protein
MINTSAGTANIPGTLTDRGGRYQWVVREGGGIRVAVLGPVRACTDPFFLDENAPHGFTGNISGYNLVASKSRRLNVAGTAPDKRSDDAWTWSSVL